MRVYYPGHRYELSQLDGSDVSTQILQFVQRPPLHKPWPGTTNQEVCRALIDRVKTLHFEKPWYGNPRIIDNLRDVIILHEIRAFEIRSRLSRLRATDAVNRWRNKYHSTKYVEDIPVDEKGHWRIESNG